MARKSCRPAASKEQVLTAQRTRCASCGQPMWMAYRTHRTITTSRETTASRLASAVVVTSSALATIPPIGQKKRDAGPYRTASLAMSVIALVGSLRYASHRSVPEIQQALCDRGLSIAERTVTHLLQRYEELVALRLTDQQRLLQQHGQESPCPRWMTARLSAMKCSGSCVTAFQEKSCLLAVCSARVKRILLSCFRRSIRHFLSPSKELSRMGNVPSATPLGRHCRTLWAPAPRNHRLQAGLKTLNQVVYDMISQRRQRLADSPAEALDLLSMLLSARDEEIGEGMNDQQVRDEIMTLLLAGHETTSATLTWTWYLLSQHPEIEQRLHDEVDRVLGGQIPTVDRLGDLPYTRNVLQEAMRLYPPAFFIIRHAIASDEIGGYPVPANSLIFLMAHMLHRHPAFWEEPERFDPDRFTPERSTNRPRYAYIPFGGGPRLCIGSSLAMMEAQLVLATVAQRYSLRLVPGHRVELQVSVATRPRHGLPVTLHPR